MSYRFPDVEAALLEVIPDSTLWLTSTNGTVHHVYSVGGSVAGPLRTDRVVVDTYAPGRDAAKAAAEGQMGRLTAGPHHTSEGLLDSVTVETAPHLIPYPDDMVTQYQATYRVDTRPL